MTFVGERSMRSTFVPTSARATQVEFDDDRMIVLLEDGRVISVPLEWFPRLLHATENQRRAVRISRHGHGLHWDQIDEDLAVAGLLAGG
jgi:hypothetical protein